MGMNDHIADHIDELILEAEHGKPVIGHARGLATAPPTLRLLPPEGLGRESAKQKGRRLLTEGRLVVTGVGSEIRARCRGDSGAVYELGWIRAGGWFCACEAQGLCSHLVALQLVTLRP